MTILILVIGLAVALGFLFTSPSIDCSTGTCEEPSVQEQISQPVAVGCAVALLAVAFWPAAKPWRRWLLVAGVPLALIGSLWFADAAGASLGWLDRPVFGPDPPCNDTGEDGHSSTKCAGDLFTWGAILLLFGYVGLGALGVLTVKSAIRLARAAQDKARP